MNYRTLTVAVALIAVRLVVPFASAEAKAYDTVFYKGKAAGLRIIFESRPRPRGGQQCQDHRICEWENNEVLSDG